MPCRPTRNRGQAIIHPSQVEPANRIYTPSAAELEHYRRLLEASAAEAGHGSTTYRGRMIDQTQAAPALEVLDLAEALPRDS
jgi:citrate lyase subunit beta/citryl-CoA lyase